RRHVGLDADAHRHAGVVAARDLLEHHRGVGPVESEPTPARVVADTEHAELAHAPEQRLVDPAHRVELARAWPELVLHEATDGRAESLVLGRRVDLTARLDDAHRRGL